MSRLVLHAPGVHTGGGLVLLQELLRAADGHLSFANLDTRALPLLVVRPACEVNGVEPTLWARLRAELRLASIARADDVVLCFHGMPPLAAVAGRVVVFLQNRNYLGVDPLSSFEGRTRWRLAIERFICRAFRARVSEYVVQSLSMGRLTTTWHGGAPRVRVIPFLDPLPSRAPRAETVEHDFIYVADGEAHKNHRNLIAAWALLAADGLRPKLALTLDERYRGVVDEVDAQRRRHDLQIRNLGRLDRSKLLELYTRCGALIFPSCSESFGLPLLEAAAAGLPIVAAERDYVRDVCDPTHTFDPDSPVSIARAVRRFLNLAETRPHTRSGSEFLAELLK